MQNDIVEFREVIPKRKRKTKIYEVRTIKNKEYVGSIEWITAVRAYAYIPFYGFNYAPTALNLISTFILMLERDHKRAKRKAQGEYAP